MEDELLNVLEDGEFLVTRHSGRLQVHPADRSKVSMWSPTLRIVVKENGPDSMYPLKVTAPDILVTIHARATD
jgi:hypothetical protein